MRQDVPRRAAVGVLAGGAGFLIERAHGQVVWQVDASKCVNSRLGEEGVEACNLCTSECVVSLSAVRAVNEHAKCGRCNICPAYFNITSAVDEKGLPSDMPALSSTPTRNPEWMLRYGIPEYRLPKAALDAEIAVVRRLGAEFRLNTRWGVDFTLSELRARYQAVFVAIGAQGAQMLRCPGKSLLYPASPFWSKSPPAEYLRSARM
jgi:hypothetical protein